MEIVAFIGFPENRLLGNEQTASGPTLNGALVVDATFCVISEGCDHVQGAFGKVAPRNKKSVGEFSIWKQ